MYTFHYFKALPEDRQLEALSYDGIPLDLTRNIKSAEAVLFAYHDFYVELVVEKFTDDILALKCFKNLKKLEPYLHQIDITEINALLDCSE